MNGTEWIKELWTEAVLTVLAVVLSVGAAWLGRKLAQWKKALFCSEEAASVARTCVLAVEQMYGAGGGEKKLAEALSLAETLLQEKGLSVTRTQLTVLAEAALAQLNGAFEREAGHGVD